LTTVVLVVLGVIWAAVLIVPFVRSRAGRTFSDSVGTFSRHITSLEQAAPVRFTPANRLRGPVGPIPPYRPPAAIAHQAGLPPVVSRTGRNSPTGVLRRRQAQRRRRDILLVLVLAMIATLGAGMMPHLGVLLYGQAMCDVLFLGYVGLLVNAQAARRRARHPRIAYLPRRANSVPLYSSSMQPAMRRPRAVRDAVGYDEVGYGYNRSPALAMAGSGGR
jgi:hypothetical protein